MWVENISLESFRNIEYMNIDFTDGINVIYGENGQGKTNIIEAIWLFTGFHSFRTRITSDYIGFGYENAKLKIKYHDSYGENIAEMTIDNKNGKRMSVNGSVEMSAPSFIGRFLATVFSPATMDIINGGPLERRKFMDTAISSLYPKYTLDIARYNKIVKMRNATLKRYYTNVEANKLFLDYYDKEMVEIGSRIIVQRDDYITKLKLYAYDAYNRIASNKDEMKLRYINNVSLMPDSDIHKVEKEFEQKLRQARNSDLERLTTSVGPHRDDMLFFVDSKKAKTFASQGQKRSTALAVKFAEAVMLGFMTDETPIILLDDVMSELDKERQKDLFKSMKKCQTFVTCCDKSQAKRLVSGKFYEIKDGEIFY